MLRLLGRGTSNNVQKVLWLLEELGVACEQEDYGGPFGKNRSSEYLALNPNGTVPTLIDGDAVLWESNSIVRYLASKYASPLYPADLVRRAHTEKWMDWQLATLAPVFRPLFIGLVREGRKMEELREQRAAAAKAFQILERTLTPHGYIAGKEMTLADIAIGPMIHRWYTLGLANEDTPLLRQLLARFQAMPAFRKHVMIELA